MWAVEVESVIAAITHRSGMYKPFEIVFHILQVFRCLCSATTFSSEVFRNLLGCFRFRVSDIVFSIRLSLSTTFVRLLVARIFPIQIDPPLLGTHLYSSPGLALSCFNPALDSCVG